MKLASKQGYTLVELMVVMAILALLALIAIPAYNNYRLHANRSEARAALLDGAQTLERYFVRNNTYATATVATGGTIEPTTDNGLYTLAFSAGPTATTYTLRATATGAQAADTDCPNLTINQLGVKAPATCW